MTRLYAGHNHQQVYHLNSIYEIPMNSKPSTATQDVRREVVATLEVVADSETSFLPDKVHLRKLLGNIIWVMATDTFLFTPEQRGGIDEMSADDYLKGIDNACDVAQLLAKALSKNEGFREYVNSEQEFDLTMGDIAQEAIKNIAKSKGIPQSKLMFRYGLLWGCHELITTGYSNYYEFLWLSND